MRALRFATLLLLAASFVLAGCKSTGSQEYIPGKGWRLIR